MTPMIARSKIGPTQNIKIVLTPQATQEQHLKKSINSKISGASNPAILVCLRLSAARTRVFEAIAQAGTHRDASNVYQFKRTRKILIAVKDFQKFAEPAS